MTYRQFMAWLIDGPAVVKWEQGKGDLPAGEVPPPDLKSLGLG